MKLPKEYQELLKLAEQQGWTVVRRNNTHLAWVSPTGAKVYSSATPSDWRAVLNLKRDLRRYGLKV
jgi:hypothetical protein